MTLRDLAAGLISALYPLPAEVADVEAEPWLDLNRFQARERLAVHEARTAAELESRVVTRRTAA